MKPSLTHNVGRLFVLTVVAAVVAVLNVPFFNSGFKNAVYSLLAPIQQNVWAAGAGTYKFFGSFASADSAVRENEKLREQVNNLMAKNAQVQELKKENDFLRQGLNLELDKDFDLKLANVISKLVEQDVLIVDKGSRDMVDVGMPVITAQKSLVGKIVKVYDGFSEVALVTGKDFSFDAKIGDEGIDGLVKGQGSCRAAVSLVPKGKDLKSGTVVSTSTLGGIFPAGLLVGTINEVNKNDVETFQSASVSLAFDVSGISQVFIANSKYPMGFETKINREVK